MQIGQVVTIPSVGWKSGRMPFVGPVGECVQPNLSLKGRAVKQVRNLSQ
jgi:hypothetical protein